MITKRFLDEFGSDEKELASTTTETVPAEKGLRASEPRKGKISNSRSGLVKLRDRPNNVKGKVIGFLREGDVVTCLKDEGPAYCKVKVDSTGMIGYLSKEFYEEG